MASDRRLHLVPFDPTDSSLAGILMKESQDILTDINQIASVLSLYFQWPDYRISFVKTSTSADAFRCDISYDLEERHPTELWLTASSENFDNLSKEKNLTVRFEIFKTCYEFSCALLAVNQNKLIITVPKEVRVYKNRRLPRYSIPKEVPKLGLEERNGNLHKAQLVEIGLNSMKVLLLSSPSPTTEDFYLKIDDLKIKSSIVRSDASGVVVAITFEGISEYKKYFEYYSSIVYPNLKKRALFPHDTILKLYAECGYFKKFSQRTEVAASEISLLWSSLDDDTALTADYIVTDNDGRPTGASSCSFAFIKESIPTWAFHQLCAKTNPDLLDSSGTLYYWRAEFLAGFPDHLQVVGWYDSGSRWLERIYSKFIKYSGSKNSLFPVSVAQQKVKHSDFSSLPISRTTIGTSSRHMADGKNLFSGIGPRHYNLSNALEAVICLDATLDDDISGHASQLASSIYNNEDESFVEITKPYSAPSSEDAKLVENCDRFFIIQKKQLVDFLASVEHSLATTIKKKKHGYGTP